MVIIPRWRRAIFSFLAPLFFSTLLAFPGTPTRPAGAAPPPSKAQLESAYLYNFLLFVHWPQEREESGGQTTMTICILGDETLAAEFAPVTGKAIKETKYLLKIKSLRPPLKPDDLADCALLFIAAQTATPLREILALVKGLPILTVSDRPEFTHEGGMLALVEAQGKLRWRVNQMAASQVGLRFDSQLLRNAESVLTSRPEGQ